MLKVRRNATLSLRCFYLVYSEIRRPVARYRPTVRPSCRATGPPTGARENHRRVHRNSSACTHAFLMPLMRVSLCNDLSCYPPENRYERRRSTRRRRSNATLAERMNAPTNLPRAVDCTTKSINFLIFDRAHERSMRGERKKSPGSRERDWVKR